MQALFFNHLSLGKNGGVTEYAVTNGTSGSGKASAKASESQRGSIESNWKRQQTRNRTNTLLRQRQQQNQQQNQRTAEQEQPLPPNSKEQKKTDSKEPLNIVLFYADDWTMKTLGTLNQNVKTPVLDELASQGVLFTNNCVTTSICWISRATMVTGQTAGRHGHLKIAQQILYENNKWNQTLFPLLKKAGYWTGFVGKWHAPSPPEHMKYTFDYKNFYYGSHWEQRKGVQRHVTDLNREDAIHFLRDRPDKKQKFALTVSFFATHAVDGAPYPDQYQPMPVSEKWYPNATTHIPNPVTNTQQHWDDLPWFFDDRNEGRGRWKNRYDTVDRYQVSMKNYYRMASEVDYACGEVIKELKKQGVYDNTLIIFTTDNGVSTVLLYHVFVHVVFVHDVCALQCNRSLCRTNTTDTHTLFDTELSRRARNE
jgi:arylsulfatase A-like enzyme